MYKNVSGFVRPSTAKIVPGLLLILRRTIAVSSVVALTISRTHVDKKDSQYSLTIGHVQQLSLLDQAMSAT